MNELVVKKEDIKQGNDLAKAARIIAIVIFATIFTALIGAFVSDIVIFSSQIAGFIGACVVAVGAFIIGIILMIISIIFIFGVYLLEEYGFWPLTWSKDAFLAVLSDLKVTEDQIHTLIMVRILLLFICVLVLAAAIVALVLVSNAKKLNPEVKNGLTKAFSIIAIIFSSLGIFMALAMLLLFLLLG